MSQANLISVLREKLSSAQQKNRRFSLRSFAKRLEVSPATLSRLFRGDRKLSLETARQIGHRLGLSPTEMVLFLSDFDPSSRPAFATHALDHEQFSLIADWYHYALLALSETTDFRCEIDWICSRLGLERQTVIDAVRRLHSLGLVEIGKNGELRRTKRNLQASDDVVNPALRRAHRQNLELAATSLENDPLEARDFTFMNMAIDVSKLPEAKEKIRRFREEMCHLLENENQSEVYRLCIQLFPLSKQRKGPNA